MRRFRLRAFRHIAVLLLLFSTESGAFAGSAVWGLAPGSDDWNTAANWLPATVPNGPLDIATFALSATTRLSISASTEVNSIVFNLAANAFTIAANPTSSLTLSGIGITDLSGIRQNFVSDVDVSTGSLGIITFTNSATAADAIFTNNGAALSGAVSGGVTQFLDFSAAGTSTIVSNGGLVSGAGGAIAQFFDRATADNATITTNGGAVSGAGGAFTNFWVSSTAGNATLIANDGSTNGAAGGTLEFFTTSNGGTARVEVFGNGNLDISSHNFPGVTVGSIEGDGQVFLGPNTVNVGSNNVSTTFSGVIQDNGGAFNGTGSLAKLGRGKLILTGANTYTGRTAVSHGTLLVRNTSGSGTGSGPVQVNGGTLGGTGTIAGAVTVGKGTGPGALLSPGSRVTLGTLTIQNALTFNADGTYDFELNSSRGVSDEVVANRVTIKNGASFSFIDNGNAALPLGTAFTVISNTSDTPILGNFSNLANASTVTVGSNTYQVNYEGGDGNDLTLTVVP